MNVNAVARHPVPAPPTRTLRPKDEHGPDLVVDDIVSNPMAPFPGEPVTFGVTVRNQGDRDAGPFNVELTSDGMDDKERLPKGLKAGASAVLDPMGPLQTMPGQNFYWVQATADSDNEVPETREDNNSAWTTVMPQQPPQPPPLPPLPPIPHPPPHVLLAE